LPSRLLQLSTTESLADKVLCWRHVSSTEATAHGDFLIFLALFLNSLAYSLMSQQEACLSKLDKSNCMMLTFRVFCLVFVECWIKVVKGVIASCAVAAAVELQHLSAHLHRRSATSRH